MKESEQNMEYGNKNERKNWKARSMRGLEEEARK
jgi:hypothetical protein